MELGNGHADFQANSGLTDLFIFHITSPQHAFTKVQTESFFLITFSRNVVSYCWRFLSKQSNNAYGTNPLVNDENDDDHHHDPKALKIANTIPKLSG